MNDTTPMAKRIPQGSSISAREKPRQIAPSIARMAHFTGLTWLTVRMNGGMTNAVAAPAGQTDELQRLDHAPLEQWSGQPLQPAEKREVFFP